MSENTGRLALPLLQPSQAQKHVTHNEALLRLDVLTQLSAEMTGADMPPSLPETGAIYALGGAPAGDWAGQAGKLAYWDGNAWLFLPPRPGWRLWDRQAGRLLVHEQGGWQDIFPDLNNVDGLGIGTAWDETNRLALSADASLFSHGGTDHRLKVNKALPADTSSVLFQSGWAGCAEIGLTGDNDLHVKVSGDGQSWTDALVVDAATGTLAGTAVQSDRSDGTAGRLMAVGAFGLGEATACPTIGDADDHALASGIYRVTGATGNRPFDFGTMLVIHNEADRVTQIAQQVLASGAHGAIRYRHYFDGNWSPWAVVCSTANLLGSVAQSGGVPIGAVIERGANANGEYVRFADGTQICTRRHDFDALAITAPMGSLYRSNGLGSLAFPAAFAAVDHADAFVHRSQNAIHRNAMVGVRLRRGQTTSLLAWEGIDVMTSLSGAAAAGELTTLSFLAIGRWF